MSLDERAADSARERGFGYPVVRPVNEILATGSAWVTEEELSRLCRLANWALAHGYNDSAEVDC